MEQFAEWNGVINDFVWGPVMLVLLVGCGVYMSIRLGFIQFRRFGFAMKNTLGKIFHKHEAGEGEVTPLQAVTTALAATVGTGNIAGVTGAIVAGGPGAIFWMWVSAVFGMVTKYSEVLLSIKYRERNEHGDWVGGPMYYIKNGLGRAWKWLGAVFCVFGALAAFGIGNMTQVNTIATSINTALASFGVNVEANTVGIFGQNVPVSSIVIGAILAVIVAVVVVGGIKRIGQVTQHLVPIMALIYILLSLMVIFSNLGLAGTAFGMIFKGAFSAEAAIGGAYGIMLKTIIQKGVARGVFSNEAGMGSAPIAHAASSESDPVRQGLYGIFEVFMDTIVICTMTSLVVLIGYLRGAIAPEWSGSGGTPLVSASFGSALGSTQIGALIVAVAISLFALSTVLSWSLYGVRCFEFLFGIGPTKVYKWVFVVVILIGSTLKMQLVWDIADTLNGLMSIPNLIALFALSGVVAKTTKEFFGNKENLV
ncbi:MAG: sodium:alanine symporter family protein [Lachnospiraceae bacterium]|nr:sodium:alanine symporter family protein [Lachnospiraceae bacterium]